MIKIIGLAMFAALLITPSSGTSCMWAGREYASDTTKINAGICQRCQDGDWFDRDVNTCDECKAAPEGALVNRDAGPRDCTAQHDPNSAKLTFSDNAWVKQADGTYQRCVAGQWVVKTPAPKQICNRNQ
jgi:hypothetical protein